MKNWLLLLLLAPSGMLGAQASQREAGMGRIIVTLRDTVHGDTLIRGSVCTTLGHDSVRTMHCAPQTTGSLFIISDLPPDSYDIGAACARDHGYGGFAEGIGSGRVRVIDSTPVAVTIYVAFQGCDTRPMRRVTGVMRGHYLSGFEEGRLTPCRPAQWFVEADHGRSIWLDSRDRNVFQRVRWPEAGKIYVDSSRKVELDGYGSYYVELHGTFEGPGQYGHMGIAEYHFIADSVLSVQTPRAGDCER